MPVAADIWKYGMYIYRNGVMMLSMSRQINVPVPDEIFEKAKKCAESANMFFKAWVCRALKAAIKREERKAAD